MKPWFPFFVRLDGAAGLLVGGGRVALRKAEKLLPYGPRLTVVAPEFCPELIRLAEDAGLELLPRAFSETDLDASPAFVIAAAGDEAMDRRIAALCRQRGILVNAADTPEACGFLFPALVQRGRLSVGISTGGASPTAAVWLKEQIERLLPPDFAGALDRLAGRREKVRAGCAEEAERAQRFREEFARELAGSAGRVVLVGAGCGKADLITVRGLRLLRRCRAVVYDDLIDPALLDEAPAGAERIYMGKRSGRQAASQEEISRLLVELAREGGLVVRLKGGDPFVFGRGGEEALALQQAGIPFEVVPGISSAIAVPAEAGIPVTHRALSRSVHIMTAHTAPGSQPEFSRCAALDGTLVFLMGVQRLPQIAEGLIRGGMPPETPAAVVSGGNAARPAAVRAPLSRIAEAARQAEITAPAVIVVGETAAMDLTFRPDGDDAL